MGYFLFRIILQLSCDKIVLSKFGRNHFLVVYKNETIKLSSIFFFYSIIFDIVELLMCNFQNSLLVDSNYKGVLIC